MHRLGFRSSDVAQLIQYLKAHPFIRVASVFSHLASAGDPDARAYTLGQIQLFDAFYQSLSEGLGYKPMRHILNTGGAVYFPEYQYEAVRLGIGLYGAGMPEMHGQLQPVHTLKARLSQVHNIAEGDSVGYDRAFIAPKAMRIGTINVGYADGLRRCAGNQKYSVLIHGNPAPILGKVCMDMAMVDLTNQPEAQQGDEVIVFGQTHSIDHLPEVCDTNAYEILTGISQRVARVFLYS
jgi:alanine racemase